ncbi:MAG: T9SS type A sorting domain-containing protein [Lewinellaceae bacterium]|nr:T9SS type A sorting domain-containing protein [Lewinellaceae bacterium]
MQKTCSFSILALLFACLPAYSQLTLQVTTIPANTPAGANIHAVGTFNNWTAGDPGTILMPLPAGGYSITLNPPAGEVKFKFTRGSWATVEGNANGGYLPDRTLTYSGQPTTVTLSILSWEDLGGSNSTAAPNVSLLSNNFYMPQLNRNRRIWIYLPPDYHTTSKKYPVLYMHDAQNLFDAATSFSGEWEVDESLNTLHQQGDHGCIVVGIDNGGGERLNEYSPWVNLQYNAGGQGDEYVEFIASTLKPHIDSTFRTLPGRTTTGIMGSSMGGLISMYAFSERQDVFSRAGILSPAFWFGGSEPATHVAGHPREGEARVYFLAGGQEPASVAQNMQVVANAMDTAGFFNNEKYITVPSDGQHSEWFWRREFPAAYVWLFAGAVSSTGSPAPEEPLGVFPNPAGSWVRISGVNATDKVQVQIANAAGKRLRSTTLQGSEALWTGDLPAGFYVLKIRKTGEKWKTVKLIRQ